MFFVKKIATLRFKKQMAGQERYPVSSGHDDTEGTGEQPKVSERISFWP
jgi:hypothetical protein